MRAQELLQKLLKAKADCDGLLLIRLDETASINDWILDYLSEIKPMARRVRSDRNPPAPLVIDALSSAAAGVPDGAAVLRYNRPEFEGLLKAWVEHLPVTCEMAA